MSVALAMGKHIPDGKNVRAWISLQSWQEAQSFLGAARGPYLGVLNDGGDPE